jgi:predicted nucleic acid-binding protein
MTGKYREANTEADLALPRRSIETALRGMHRQSSQAAITLPNEYGAFGEAGLSTVFPMVIDANALRDELLRTTRMNQRTILCNAANSGVLRLFCAAHVVEEVHKHAAEWATTQGLDPAAVQAVWETSYLPLLRCVAIPQPLTTARENERLAVLANPTSRYGDPDDVPTAALALLLGAPLLSKDASPLRAVYGEGFDHLAHAHWLRALSAGGDLGPLSQYMQTASMAMFALGYGIYAGVRGLACRIPLPWLVVGGAVAIGLGSLFIPPASKQRARTTAGSFFAGSLELLGEIAMLHSAAKRQFDTLAAPRPSWEDVTNEVGGNRALMRHALYHLARSPSSDLSAAELRERLRLDDSVPHGEAKVRAVLRAGCCFEQIYPGRFQVGAALVRGAATKPDLLGGGLLGVESPRDR